MKVIPLNQGKYAIVDDIDYERVSALKWYVNQSGRDKTWYAITNTGRFRMHRFILCLTDPKIEVDHIDGDGLNNTRNNLRIATRTQNLANQQKRENTSSKFKGVSLDRRRNKWQSNIRMNGKRKWLGQFNNELDAAKCYNVAAIEFFGDFAKLNPVSEE